MTDPKITKKDRVWVWRWIGITLKDTSAARRYLSRSPTITHHLQDNPQMDADRRS